MSKSKKARKANKKKLTQQSRPSLPANSTLDQNETDEISEISRPASVPIEEQAEDTPVATALEDYNSPLQQPFIHDPGTGPRVRDTRAFLSSRFALKPSLDDELCAEFAQLEVLQMLSTVLPEETALILWYNKSRARSRICPACQRLYQLGDVLPDPIGADNPTVASLGDNVSREQQLSGLCSPVCFILASYNHQKATSRTWGKTAVEMDEETWILLNDGAGAGHSDRGLGMLVRMTRLDDLGLGQLCMPELNFEEDAG